MDYFFRKLFVFALPALIYALVSMVFMPFLLSIQNGPSTKQQIITSFENAQNTDYELLILGNSKTYRGINPEMLELKSFNFSHDNDTYNQLYHKLNFLLKKQKNIDYLILGVDYFQFSFKSDTRNYIYADLLGEEYMRDYPEYSLILNKVEYHFSNINPRKLLSLFPKETKPFLRNNGQFIKPGVAKESDVITRDAGRLNFQITYFNKILSLCESKNIKVFLVMLPTRKNELNSYTDAQLIEFNNFIRKSVDNKTVYYLNYSTINGFKTEDYTDITHLNEVSASRFSKILNDDLKALISD